MSDVSIRYNQLNADEFIELWNSVWDDPPTKEQVELAMANSLFRVSIFVDDKIAAMARVIGDKGLCYYIKDVVVKPEFQYKGLGRILMTRVLKFVNDNGIDKTKIMVELCAMPEIIPFYEKFGFGSNEAKRLRLFHEVGDDLSGNKLSDDQLYFVKGAGGADVALSSDDPILQVNHTILQEYLKMPI